MDIAALKDELRERGAGLVSSSPVSVRGKLAEALRRDPVYRTAARIFAPPSPLLLQVRVNSLIDGKELIMPAPGLREGFYLLKPYTIPFADLLTGVTYKGLARYGRKLSEGDIARLAIPLLIADSLALDSRGRRLGDGKGFFDLSCAVLAELAGLAEDFNCCGLVADSNLIVPEVPVEPWDIQCSMIAGPDGVWQTGIKEKRPVVFWEALDQRRIKRLAPLWKLRSG